MANVREALYQCIPQELAGADGTKGIKLFTATDTHFNVELFIEYLNNSSKATVWVSLLGDGKYRLLDMLNAEGLSFYYIKNSWYVNIANTDASSKVLIRKKLNYGKFSNLLSINSTDTLSGTPCFTINSGTGTNIVYLSNGDVTCQKLTTSTINPIDETNCTISVNGNISTTYDITTSSSVTTDHLISNDAKIINELTADTSSINTLTVKGKLTVSGNGIATDFLTVSNNTTCTGALECKSTITVAGKSTLNGGITTTGISSSGTICATSGDINCQDGNINCKNKVEASYFNAISDKRLKENIIEYSPKKSILDLKTYKYNFISDENKVEHVGCIAQELQEIAPELVHENSNGYLSVEDNKVVYLLISEVAALKKEIDSLKAEITELRK